MTLSRVQFERVSSELGAALSGLKRSRVADSGTALCATIAKEDLHAPGRDYSKDAASVLDKVTYEALRTAYQGQVNANDSFFRAVDSLWRDLEDIRVAFLFNRGQFGLAVGGLDPDSLDGLAEIFSRLGEIVSPSRLTDGSGQVYRRITANGGRQTFPEIAEHCKRLAAAKRAERSN